jgi:hypothetical protein
MGVQKAVVVAFYQLRCFARTGVGASLKIAGHGHCDGQLPKMTRRKRLMATAK